MKCPVCDSEPVAIKHKRSVTTGQRYTVARCQEGHQYGVKDKEGYRPSV